MTAKTVVGSDMEPSISHGDRVWFMPVTAPLPGDVVRFADPLDPDQKIIRRVLAIGGQTITYDEDTIRVEKKRLRKQAMGDSGDYHVAQETLWAKKPEKGHAWLTRQIAYPATHWSAEPITVPEGHVYVLADDRDSAVDSRWWGTVPVESIQGVLRFRWGPSHTWRQEFEWMVGTPPFRD